jgi:hypothetical protein
MSVTNLFEARRKGFVLRSVTLTAATYTVKTGRPADGYIQDRVVNATATPCVITVPDGVYEGQRLLIRCSDASITGEAAVETDTGDDTDLNADDEFISLEWVNATSGWQTLGINT